MEGTIILENFDGDLISSFQEALKADKHILLKRLNGSKFEVFSKENFGNLSMIEKELFFIKGEIFQAENQSFIRYTVRANATFKTLCIILPLFTSELLIFSLDKNLKHDLGLIGVFIYLIINGVSLPILLYQDYKLKQKGKFYFMKLVERIKTSKGLTRKNY